MKSSMQGINHGPMQENSVMKKYSGLELLKLRKTFNKQGKSLSQAGSEAVGHGNGRDQSECGFRNTE